MIRITLALASAALLCACATTEPGWTGTSAVPFGEAESACTAGAAQIADAAQRDRAFTDCMADKGWTRPAPR